MSISKAGVGMYVTVIVLVLQWLGVQADVGATTEAVLGGIQLAAFLVWVYGQVTRKDVKFGIIKE
jgi:hypothetical protein